MFVPFYSREMLYFLRLNQVWNVSIYLFFFFLFFRFSLLPTFFDDFPAAVFVPAFFTSFTLGGGGGFLCAMNFSHMALDHGLGILYSTFILCLLSGFSQFFLILSTNMFGLSSMSTCRCLSGTSFSRKWSFSDSTSSVGSFALLDSETGWTVIVRLASWLSFLWNKVIFILKKIDNRIGLLCYNLYLSSFGSIFRKITFGGIMSARDLHFCSQSLSAVLSFSIWCWTLITSLLSLIVASSSL